jgi:hypothetical protein
MLRAGKYLPEGIDLPHLIAPPVEGKGNDRGSISRIVPLKVDNAKRTDVGDETPVFIANSLNTEQLPVDIIKVVLGANKLRIRGG